VREIIDQYAINPCQLKLELTEKMVLEKIDTNIGKMLNLKAIGVVLAMDNFGTGYSSLNYLRTLPFDQIKIDRSFMTAIKENSTDAFIVSSILNLGQLLRMTVVVEGIENAEQYGLVKSMGCKSFQGYFFGHPVSIEAIEIIFAPDF